MSYVKKSTFKFVGYPTYSTKSITQPGQTVNLEEVVTRLQRGEKVSMFDAFNDKNADFDTVVLHRNDLKNMTSEQVERLTQALQANKDGSSVSGDVITGQNTVANDEHKV